MRIIDCFIELMAFVALTSKDMPSNQPRYEHIRDNVMRLISHSESMLNSGNFSAHDVELAKFAVLAWIDETFLGIQWPGRDKWQREQLQRLYFGTTKAGEEFFERLNTLGVEQRDVREVYYLCLALGFSGRYLHEDDRFLLNQLRTSNLKFLFGSSVGLPSLQDISLFPNAAPSEAASGPPPKKRSGLNTYTLIGLGAPIAVFGILYAIFTFILNGYSDNILKMVS